MRAMRRVTRLARSETWDWTLKRTFHGIEASSTLPPQKRFTARATTRLRIASEMSDSTAITALAHIASGIASVGLKATESGGFRGSRWSPNCGRQPGAIAGLKLLWEGDVGRRVGVMGAGPNSPPPRRGLQARLERRFVSEPPTPLRAAAYIATGALTVSIVAGAIAH